MPTREPGTTLALLSGNMALYRGIVALAHRTAGSEKLEYSVDFLCRGQSLWSIFGLLQLADYIEVAADHCRMHIADNCYALRRLSSAPAATRRRHLHHTQSERRDCSIQAETLRNFAGRTDFPKRYAHNMLVHAFPLKKVNLWNHFPEWGWNILLDLLELLTGLRGTRGWNIHATTGTLINTENYKCLR